MAKSVHYFSIFSVFISLFLTTSITGEHHLLGNPSPVENELPKEKLTHFLVYLHITVSGPNPNAVMAVRPPNNASNTLFGMITMMDGRLTVSPKMDSKVVGQAQGLYAYVSQTEVVLMMAMNFVFSDGKYNGSTVSILGSNAIMTQVREMPIIGGTGLFRFSTGYVEARTHTYDLKTGYAIVECNVYVRNYRNRKLGF